MLLSLVLRIDTLYTKQTNAKKEGKIGYLKNWLEFRTVS